MPNATQSWHSWAMDALGVDVPDYPSMEQMADIAANLYWVNRRNPAKRPPTQDPRCGTEPGYQAHTSRREFACRPCKDAYALKKAAYRRRKALGITTPRPALKPCGTYAAAARHILAKELLCAPCAAARSAYFQAKYLERRARQDAAATRPVRTLARRIATPQPEEDHERLSA